MENILFLELSFIVEVSPHVSVYQFLIDSVTVLLTGSTVYCSAVKNTWKHWYLVSTFAKLQWPQVHGILFYSVRQSIHYQWSYLLQVGTSASLKGSKNWYYMIENSWKQGHVVRNQQETINLNPPYLWNNCVTSWYIFWKLTQLFQWQEPIIIIAWIKITEYPAT